MSNSPTAHALTVAEQWALEGKAAALATVVETWGSAPLPAGSQMAIDANGNFCGSLSRGCIEGEVVAAAIEIIRTGEPRLLDFGVTDATARDAGLSCGGRIQVYVERID